MKRKFLGAVAMSIALGTPAAAFAGEGDYVKKEDLPEAARKTLEQEVGDGNIKEIEVETERGKKVYDVEFTKDGKKHEIEISEDGKVLERETEKEEAY